MGLWEKKRPYKTILGLEFHNYQRPHQGLHYKTSAEVYFADQTGKQLSQLEMEDSTLF
jgi:hypothetical protein